MTVSWSLLLTTALVVRPTPQAQASRLSGATMCDAPPAVNGAPPPTLRTPPPGGTPPAAATGPPAGGPPPRTPLLQLLDSLFELGFGLLYALEPDGMLDSSKNLRVLWVRALLAAAGELDDDVARELLPASSRWVVSAPLAATVWRPALAKLAWIKQRTEFIDSALDDFLAKTDGEGAEPQVVLLGSGYDTRAIRYRDSRVRFFEVDLQSVVDVKRRMVQGCYPSSDAIPPALGLDFNKVDYSSSDPFVRLEEELGLDGSRPTLVVCEALLFYLSPPAKRSLIAAASALIQRSGSASSGIVLADNLAPFVRSPQKADAATFLAPLGLELDEHDTIWGGAIQFIRASEASASSE